MDQPVNPPRAYDGGRRREQARQTRRAMLDAAHDLFLGHGYAATTLPMVAAAAGVSVQNVYKVFGNKPGLVKTLFDVRIAGDDAPVPMMDRETVARIRAEADPIEKLAQYGAHMSRVGPRIMPLLLVVRDAAASDAGAAAVWATLQKERLTGMVMLAAHLESEHHLRDGVSRDEARDVLWTYNSLEIWDLLVNQRRWTAKRYGTWIARQLTSALL
jgi:AcrR family transcriptional regulator